MPKPQMVTADELKKGIDQVTDEVKNVQKSIAPAVAAAEAKIGGQIKALKDQVDNNAEVSKAATERITSDAKEYTDLRINALQNTITDMIKRNDNMLKEVEQSLATRLSKIDTDVRSALAEELTALCERIDNEFQSVRSDIQNADMQQARKTAEAVAAMKTQLDNTAAGLNAEVATREKESKETAEKLKKWTEEAEKAHQRREHENSLRETQLMERLQRVDELLEETKENAAAHTGSVEKKLYAEITDLKIESIRRLEAVDEESMKIRDAIAEVENNSTRRVDWIIRNASTSIRPHQGKTGIHTSWFSPKFNAGGAHGLQLELQLFKAADPPVEGEKAGDVACYLWACRGMNLVYKLSVGGKSVTLEKIFNGRIPYGTKRFCWLKDQINRDDDTLKISVEILESVREIENQWKSPPATSALEEYGEAPPENPIKQAYDAKPLDGFIVFKRHINNRVLDQVNGQVEMIRNRSVRSIEWKLDSASMLRRCFPPGEAICSATFGAAGVDGMQLIFYPCGYKGATDGFCSFFLFAPAGLTMKCSLSAGDQKRDASHTWEAGGAFGRTNFCRFEAAIDVESDSVLLAFEIEEAHQDIQARIAHPVVTAGDRRTTAQIEGSPAAAVESVVKMKRVLGKTPAGLEDRRVLPSLWTAKCLGDSTTDQQDGMHSFAEIGGKKSSAGGELRRSKSQASMQTSLQETSIGSERTGMFDSMSSAPPLPKLGKGGEWSGRGSNDEWLLGKPRKGGAKQKGGSLVAGSSQMSGLTGGSSQMSVLAGGSSLMTDVPEDF